MELIIKAQGGDKKSLEKIVKDNISLVGSVARKFFYRGYDKEDIMQIGSIGLIKAIKKFDVTQGTKFSTYAVPLIMGEIRRFLRDDGMLHVNRETKKLGKQIYYKTLELADKLNREPTNKELAESMEISEEEIRNAKYIMVPPESLEQIAYANENGHDIEIGSTIGDEINIEDEAIKELEISNLKKCIKLMPETMKNVLLLRLQNKTQTEVSRLLKIQQVQVSRLEQKGIISLKEMIGGNMIKHDDAIKMYSEGATPKEVCEKLGISISTAYTYKNEYNANIKPTEEKTVTEEKEKTITEDIKPKEIETANSIDLIVSGVNKDSIRNIVNMLISNLKDGAYNVNFVVK